MDLDATPPTLPEAAACSICLDQVVERADARSVASLLCGHKFHLGPNLHFDGSTGNGVTRTYEVLSDVQSSIDGSTPLDSVFQNRELEPISSGMEGDPTADVNNVQVFDGTEPRNSEIEQHYFGIIPVVDFVTSTTPFGFEVPRYDGSNQRRSTQPTPRTGSSSVAPFGSSPAVTSRGHLHGLRGHVVRQTVPHATRSNPYPATARRIRPRALSIASSIAASHTAEDREPHDISRARAANVQNNNIPNRDNASRHADQPYSYVLGWDTHWRPSAGRGTASSVHNQAYTSFPSRTTGELPSVYHSENFYQSPPPDRAHPFPR